MNERPTVISSHVTEELLFNFKSLGDAAFSELIHNSPGIDLSKISVNWFRKRAPTLSQSPLTLINALATLYIDENYTEKRLFDALKVSLSITPDSNFIEARDVFHPMGAIFLNAGSRKSFSQDNMFKLMDVLLGHDQSPDILNVDGQHLIETMVKHYFKHWGIVGSEKSIGLHDIQFMLLKKHYGAEKLEQMVNQTFEDADGNIGSPLAMILHRFYKWDRVDLKSYAPLEFAACLVAAGANVNEIGFSGKPILDDMPKDKNGWVKNTLATARNEFISGKAAAAMHGGVDSYAGLRRKL